MCEQQPCALPQLPPQALQPLGRRDRHLLVHAVRESEAGGSVQHNLEVPPLCVRRQRADRRGARRRQAIGGGVGGVGGGGGGGDDDIHRQLEDGVGGLQRSVRLA